MVRQAHQPMFTMDIYEFMAKMLFFLPEPNTIVRLRSLTMIRYYGIYAQSLGQRLRVIEQVAWAKAIEHCFNTNPIFCPVCKKEMELMVRLGSPTVYILIFHIMRFPS
ncbi:MAG: hypothetical protein H7A23_11190 [Leptospiraceae bacterium]|nr:hypothetical protein [Leptospiraceae bacterium]MCP5495109.1 hypothetical protein [Leptospiraceae bacterium]